MVWAVHPLAYRWIAGRRDYSEAAQRVGGSSLGGLQLQPAEERVGDAVQQLRAMFLLMWCSIRSAHKEELRSQHGYQGSTMQQSEEIATKYLQVRAPRATRPDQRPHPHAPRFVPG